jgi:quinol-cytochrome oxidoreductase complex cytochrome b subunit
MEEDDKMKSEVNGGIFEEFKRQMFEPTPDNLLYILIATIFVIEFLIMMLLPYLPPLSIMAMAVLDSLILIVFTFPALYFFSFRPLIRENIRCKNAEEELRKLQTSLGKEG